MQALDLNPRNEETDPRNDLVRGQRLAFAGASLVLGICSFISLLGVEKAILAIVFGVLALRNHPGRPIAGGRARLGIVLGALQIVLILLLLVFFHSEVMRFFESVERLQLRA